MESDWAEAEGVRRSSRVRTRGKTQSDEDCTNRYSYNMESFFFLFFSSSFSCCEWVRLGGRGDGEKPGSRKK